MKYQLFSKNEIYIALFALAGICIVGTITNIQKSLKKNKLEQLADTNKDGKLSIEEKIKMYRMCGVADKPLTYDLCRKDIKKGLESYNKINKTSTKKE